MRYNKVIRRCLLVSFGTAAVIGVGFGCILEFENTEHCWNKQGNTTCRAEFGDAAGYCSKGVPSCGDQVNALGCMSQRPEFDECYSPCGGGNSILDEDSCLDSPVGDSGESETGDSGGSETGDSEGEATTGAEEPVCGDGAREGDEECDDGNIDSGDGCLFDCKLPGAQLEQTKVTTFTDEEIVTFYVQQGHEVAIDLGGALAVMVDGHAAGAEDEDATHRLVEFNSKLNTITWSRYAPAQKRRNLAIGDDGVLFVGGQNNGARIYIYPGTDATGSTMAFADDSAFLSTAVAGTRIAAAGQTVKSPYLYRGTRDGKLGVGWKHISIEDAGTGECGPVATNAAGRIWVVCKITNMWKLYAYHADDSNPWTAVLHDAIYEELVVDEDDNVYVLANTEDATSYTLSKYDNNGAEQELQTHTGSAYGLALLPGGTLIVAGHEEEMNMKKGLLRWHDEGSGQVLHQESVVAEGEDFAFFNDVAVHPTGEFAVAVGGFVEADGLWIYKFEI